MIDICFCSDKNLIGFIPIVINSILRKNSNYKINIHYIHNINDKNKINNLEKYINEYDNLAFFSYYKTWDRKYNGLQHVSVATMLRIFIPDLIKCAKLIYLDIDIVVNLDLHELYEIDCGKTGIAIKNSIHKSWEKYFDDKSGKKSGNCGIIVMNLETLRKNNFTQKCLEIHSKNQNRHDQYVINMYANGNHTVLEPRFNIFLNQDDYLVEKETEFILHYAGGKKPYFHNAGKYQYLWDENDLEKNKEFINEIKHLSMLTNDGLNNIQNQISNCTHNNRYKKLFNYLGLNFKPKKILSFGCSNGTEVYNLLENFPDSIIHGLDINKDLIIKANNNNNNNNIEFYYDINDLNLNDYDLITCMAVLCRCPYDSEYKFSLFEKTVKNIDLFLKKNGILVIVNSNYLFEECNIFYKYNSLNINKTLLFPINKTKEYSGDLSDWVPKYHKDGTKCNTQPPVIFKKL